MPSVTVIPGISTCSNSTPRLRRRLPDGGWGPRVDQGLRMSRSELERLVPGVEVPVHVDAASGALVEIDVTALRQELKRSA